MTGNLLRVTRVLLLLATTSEGRQTAMLTRRCAWQNVETLTPTQQWELPQRTGAEDEQLHQATTFAKFQNVSRAFPSCTRSILAEIYLCHACSCQEIEVGNARAGADVGALHPGQQRRRAHALSVRGRARCLDRRSARRGGR
eukprot:COSAG01_NODE_4377_length_5085_cov_6.039110_3_plen_142_part_00